MKGNIRKTNWFLKKIFTVVENYLRECKYDYLKKGILKEKIDSVKENLSRNSYFDFNSPSIQKDLKYLYTKQTIDTAERQEEEKKRSTIVHTELK